MSKLRYFQPQLSSDEYIEQFRNDFERFPRFRNWKHFLKYVLYAIWAKITHCKITEEEISRAKQKLLEYLRAQIRDPVEYEQYEKGLERIWENLAERMRKSPACYKYFMDYATKSVSLANFMSWVPCSETMENARGYGYDIAGRYGKLDPKDVAFEWSLRTPVLAQICLRIQYTQEAFEAMRRNKKTHGIAWGKPKRNRSKQTTATKEDQAKQTTATKENQAKQTTATKENQARQVYSAQNDGSKLRVFMGAGGRIPELRSYASKLEWLEEIEFVIVDEDRGVRSNIDELFRYTYGKSLEQLGFVWVEPGMSEKEVQRIAEARKAPHRYYNMTIDEFLSRSEYYKSFDLVVLNGFMSYHRKDTALVLRQLRKLMKAEAKMIFDLQVLQLPKDFSLLQHKYALDWVTVPQLDPDLSSKSAYWRIAEACEEVGMMVEDAVIYTADPAKGAIEAGVGFTLCLRNWYQQEIE